MFNEYADVVSAKLCYHIQKIFVEKHRSLDENVLAFSWDNVWSMIKFQVLL